MRDCVICGAMISQFGPDICNTCANRIRQREIDRSNAYHAGRRAYKEGQNLCANPFKVGQVEFISWADGWIAQKYIHDAKAQIRDATGIDESSGSH